MFRPVNSKANFPQLEEKILLWWQDKAIFKRSIDQRQGSPRFVFYEGPPFANGNPGIHHVLARAFKDIIVRYKVMKGYYVPRVAGWDTHGLPVELEIERQLGFSGKEQIEKYGVAQFNQRCRESVFRYLKEWNTLTERIAYWVDLEHAYMTMSNDYIESVWWAIKQMWDKGLVYQGYRVTPHCPRCGTSLSSHEVALGYKDDVEDPSVYIKFKVVTFSIASDEEERLYGKLKDFIDSLLSKKPAYFLVWTTTPWTLPGNTALAVAPEADYAVVDMEDEYLILADALLEQVGLNRNKVVQVIKGSFLETAPYEPLFKPHDYGVKVMSFFRKDKEGAPELEWAGPPDTYPIIAGDFVSMEEGTGIVHIAPAYGEVDYQAGQDNDLDFVHMVDLQGKITGNYPFSGTFVKKADPLVIKDLAERGLLFRAETIRHTYPFCWRCEAPLLYYAKETWYIRTTALKERLIAGNAEINWYPGHIKSGRFGDWLENNVDWAFSRERYWGTPLPVWRCEKCGSFECVGSVAELKAKQGFSGLKEPLDLHRPFVDEATFACSKCGGKMSRQPEVIDCWFDSGSMPFAQMHYPFENKALFDAEMKQADFICEGVDQTRGWFYSLHAISTLLFDRPSFKNCICLELILDAQGKKMSKSRGNVVDPWTVINKYGADAMRWYFFTSAPPGNVRRFDEKMVAEVTRRFLLTLWNVYSFFVTYANIDKFTPGPAKTSLAESELDRWIISELNQLIIDVDSALDGYDPTEAGRKIESFVDVLSNWYVRRSRRRFWKSENDADKLVAYHTLYQCLVTLTKLLAPLAPFLAEELYQNLVSSVLPEAPESVHLADFPGADKSLIDKELMEATSLAMKLTSLGRAARNQAGIPVRQPLAAAASTLVSKQEESGLNRVKPWILEELNIKDLKIIGDLTKLDKTYYNPVVSDGGYSFAVQKREAISPELLAEGMAREIVHRLQTMRKSAGFDITDHIVTYYQGDDYIRGVMSNAGTADHIKQETLSIKLVEGLPGVVDFKETYTLNGYKALLAVSRAGLT
ncbi:MAG: isoleucine--tRNA ligase [Chloroflexi bacterium]|nr:isoleucine--tRNA ligase [Chloroflexota bacterium]